jgi:predicted AAA+ superfamily ATPase
MGPRQSGITTLVKSIFPQAAYVSFEDPDVRRNVELDPRGFFSSFKKMLIIDEAQRIPEVFSYIQAIVDERGKNGQFIFTGSQNYLLHEKISQSLAGRVAILRLLPLSLSELLLANKKIISIDTILQKGFYPALWKQRVDSALYYSSYVIPPRL